MSYRFVDLSPTSWCRYPLWLLCSLHLSLCFFWPQPSHLSLLWSVSSVFAVDLQWKKAFAFHFSYIFYSFILSLRAEAESFFPPAFVSYLQPKFIPAIGPLLVLFLLYNGGCSYCKDCPFQNTWPGFFMLSWAKCHHLWEKQPSFNTSSWIVFHSTTIPNFHIVFSNKA